jgi:uncharacterized protein
MPLCGVDLEGDVSFEELGIEEEVRFAFPHPLHYRLHLSPMGEDVLVRGSLSATVETVCDRCAENFELKLETDEVCHTYKNVYGQLLDLTDDIREDILLTFPQVSLCSEDCLGLCVICGHNLNQGPCGCRQDMLAEADGKDEASPWDKLDNLKLS